MTETKSIKSTPRNNLPGCALQLVFYVALVIPAYFLSVPSPITDEFNGANARRFMIAGVRGGLTSDSPTYEAISLERLNRGEPNLSGLTFLIPESKIVIHNGDINYATVLENHETWQLVAYQYSNSHTSTSVYKAYPDRVEPVSYQVDTHIGQAMLALALIIPAYLLALIFVQVRSRWLKQKHA